MNLYDEILIKNKILEMLRIKFFAADNLLSQDYWCKPLTGSPFDFSAVSMAYLFFELEKSFDIQIPEQCLCSYGFSSINQIVNIISMCKNHPAAE